MELETRDAVSMVLLPKKEMVVVCLNPTEESTLVDHKTEIVRETNSNLVKETTSLKERLIYMVSIISIIVIIASLIEYRYILPYYYTSFAPLLLIIRCIQYWQLKYQYYLLDLCYYVNISFILYIWVFPQNDNMFIVLFALSNGPLAWAMIIFRNSVVFHSTDKMTSTFIHVMPVYLVYCIRWYPESISLYWYAAFNNNFTMDVPYVFVWLVAVPFGCVVFHWVLYNVIVYGILRPTEGYEYSYRYLTTRTTIKSFTGILGPNHHLLMYNILNFSFTLCTLLLTNLWYRSFAAHSAYIAVMSLCAFWNGAGYYLDVFGKPKIGLKQ